MPFYSNLGDIVRDEGHQLRTIRNLRKLRAQLDATVPSKDAE